MNVIEIGGWEVVLFTNFHYEFSYKCYRRLGLPVGMVEKIQSNDVRRVFGLTTACTLRSQQSCDFFFRLKSAKGKFLFGK